MRSVSKKRLYHALCTCKGSDDDLELRKAYVVLPAAENEAGFLRVVDESGEDYLYPAEHFLMDYLSEAKQFHRAAIEPYKGPPVGATEAEVAALEQEIDFALPEAYRQYLLWMGRDYNGCFVGSDWFLQNGYNNGMKSNDLQDLHGLDFGQFTPPEHFFVFFMHQGYILAWFSLPKDSEDPLVYCFGEGQGMTVPKLQGSFTQFLLTELKGVASLMPRLYERRK